VTSPYTYRRLTLAELGLVNGWIQTPHVSEWWLEAGGASSLIDPADFEEADFRMWLVSYNGQPFAYMQDYNPHLYPDHYFYDRAAPARGIDQFIGAPEFMGQGHGSAFIRQRVEMLFAEGMTCVVTDPHPDNARAIRAYEKAGFTAYGQTEHPKYGRALLMQALRP
jgi:aminoglycoside 6'-N-acetyltransferase